MRTCPTCWSIHVERTYRNSFEHLLSRFGIFPFVCNECGHRFRLRYSPNPEQPQR